MAPRSSIAARAGYICVFLFTILTLAATIEAQQNKEANYLIGVGSYDITGPAADVNLMGYANPEQNAAGIHFRLRARSFIVADPAETNNRVLFVNLDACMGAQSVTLHTLARLKSRYGGLYTEKNVIISGTHTHSGPGGYLQYVLYIITSLGFVRQSFNALVDGIEQSVIQAHENLRPGSILVNEGELLGANINRSPSAYLNNPADERAKYTYDVDKTMVLAKFVDEEWGEVGAFNWFAVHGTSMNRTNKLISGDNKGAAARFMEDWYLQRSVEYSILADTKKLDFASDGHREAFHRVQSEQVSHEFYKSSGGKQSTKLSSIMHRVRSPMKDSLKPPFVAAFCQSNVGDTTPNIQGAFCVDTGLSCDFNHSTCNGQNELCIGRGPAYPDDHFASTKIIADRQFKRAVDLFDSAKEQLIGKIQYKQTYVDFSNVVVKLPNKQVIKTCPAAIGFSFAAGTTDGPGAFNFEQGDNQGNLFWKVVGSFLKKPSDEQIECQKPKPILIDTGEMYAPYAWAPSILPISILKIGQLVILGVPAEFTTMSGRRLRDAVKSTLIQQSNGEIGNDVRVVIAGLANGYSQYVATFEEYEVQRYEGASTLFGPHTLSAYIQEFTKLATALVKGNDVSPGPAPPDMVDKQLEFLPGVLMDSTPNGKNFGDVKEDVPANASYTVGDKVEVEFYTGCPRNDLLTEGTYGLVELLDSSGKWIPSYDDDDWSTRFSWYRPKTMSPESYAVITWAIPQTVQAGTYRIRHFGSYKHLFGSVKHFTGTSSSFKVVT
ncbi:neutral ceramidase [Marchantia polymorpha subsp. ruderalis]|uniref:Neutral ceramidase n=2 Tax=Marchantia polymorpha TaxID=3197 RepID=A0A176VUQ0_MARPO|nr:hypothetical protein AXG93_3042s1070 [Marchantia polymorpha subsp. ruderalis]PTQ30724.1 hypothetical protein MARPO_0120s0007 [Marchantia polymorpha]BBN08047.1 hypothetical protein Mp_4g08390 [Marchantia polymorpha subsp. ruderalis]|eukprot:PTQ30724.1 hypothetical protein MARPO_0120s0007 [Marchantia polymorpha]